MRAIVNRVPLFAPMLIGLVSCQVAGPTVETTGPDELARILAGGAPDSPQDLRAMERHVKALMQRCWPAVVDLGGATGVIVENGYVLTAGHVTEEVGRTIRMVTHDGREITGESLGLNEVTDTGLIKLTTEGEFPTLPLGASSELEVGQWCLLLGHPSGSKPGRAAPARFGRVLRVPDEGFLATDCPMQGGDSGGPLLDMSGRIIGINSRISRNIAENMHTPIDAFRREWDELVAGQHVEVDRDGRARGQRLGVRWDRKAERARIRDVMEGRLAERAGLQPGDVVLRVGDAEVESRWDVARLLSPRSRQADEVVLQIERDGEVLEVLLGGLPVVRSGGERRLRVLRGQGVLDAFADVVGDANRATVALEQEDEHRIYGLVIDRAGVVATKASTLDPGAAIRCRVDGRVFDAELVGVDDVEDLAFVRLRDARDVFVARMSEILPNAGAWLATTDGEGAPIAAGVLSSPPYSHSRRGFLGVTLDTRAAPPRVTGVSPDSAAAAAGIESDDEILAIDGTTFGDTQALIRAIGARAPGTRVQLSIRRSGSQIELEATLGQNRNSPRTAQVRIWGDLSDVRSGFGTVLQHDAFVAPENCGGPVVDLDGKVVGLNIARAGRVETLALPIATVRRSWSRVSQSSSAD